MREATNADEVLWVKVERTATAETRKTSGRCRLRLHNGHRRTIANDGGGGGWSRWLKYAIGKVKYRYVYTRIQIEYTTAYNCPIAKMVPHRVFVLLVASRTKYNIEKKNTNDNSFFTEWNVVATFIHRKSQQRERRA